MAFVVGVRVCGSVFVKFFIHEIYIISDRIILKLNFSEMNVANVVLHKIIYNIELEWSSKRMISGLQKVCI